MYTNTRTSIHTHATDTHSNPKPVNIIQRKHVLKNNKMKLPLKQYENKKKKKHSYSCRNKLLIVFQQ